jgi:hypothetical protein
MLHQCPRVERVDQGQEGGQGAVGGGARQHPEGKGATGGDPGNSQFQNQDGLEAL